MKRPRSKPNALKNNPRYIGALKYAGQGLRVFPLTPGSKKPLKSCSWPNEATTEPRTIRQWWGENPDYNVGIVCGATSGGLLVIDVDGPEGEEQLRELEARYGPLPQTRQVNTPNGVHYYFRDERGLTNSRPWAASKMDVRGNGGYVVAPPSVNEHGELYEWATDSSAPILKLPKCWFDLFGELDGSNLGGSVALSSRGQGVSGSARNTPVRAILIDKKLPLGKRIDYAIERTAPSTAGQRNRRLFEFARCLRTIPELKQKPAQEVAEHVHTWHATHRDKCSGDHTLEDCVADFCIAWEKEILEIGQGPFAALMDQARQAAVPRWAVKLPPRARDIIKLVEAMQTRAGDKPFYLGARELAEYLGDCSRTTAWKHMNMLLHYGVLEQVETGRQGRSTRWKYLGRPRKKNLSNLIKLYKLMRPRGPGRSSARRSRSSGKPRRNRP